MPACVEMGQDERHDVVSRKAGEDDGWDLETVVRGRGKCVESASWRSYCLDIRPAENQDPYVFCKSGWLVYVEHFWSELSFNFVLGASALMSKQYLQGTVTCEDTSGRDIRVSPLTLCFPHMTTTPSILNLRTRTAADAPLSTVCSI